MRSNISIKVPVKSRGWHSRNKMMTSPVVAFSQSPGSDKSSNIESVLTSRPQADCSITRLLLMSYFPRYLPTFIFTTVCNFFFKTIPLISKLL